MILICVINFLLSISTTIGMTVIPFLVTDTLGLSLFAMGLIEGGTEFFSNFFRLFTGILFDKIKNRRLIFVCPVGIAFLSKLLLLIPSPFAIVGSKMAERISNGAFAAPRDAYIGVHSKKKGTALGILNISKTLGCIIGPFVVSASTFFWGSFSENLNTLIFICCSIVSLAFLFSFLLKAPKVNSEEFYYKDIKNIVKDTSSILGVVLIFFLSRFNDGLLMMYLKQKGLPEWFYLSTISFFNIMMLFSAPLIGALIDKGLVKKCFYATTLAMILFNICFYGIDLSIWPLACLGIACWGIQRTGAQIVFSSMIFKAIDKKNYGTGIGIFYIISGVGTLIASSISGYFAKNQFSVVFLMSGIMAAICLAFGSRRLGRAYDFF